MTNLCAALPLLVVSASLAATIRVEDHGAKGDGTTLDTAAIQAAIEACTAAGGGEVLFGPHRYLTGSLELRSNVTLKLDPRAVVLGSENLADYTNGGLIRGNGVTNTGIEGGTIDGRGDIWWEKARSYTGPAWRETAQFEYQAKKRPSFVRFSGCSKVVVRDVLLTGSPSWTLHLYRSTDCLVERVKIRNPLYGPNTDGIDINSCQRVTVRDCDIITGDDGIVLKSTDPGHDHPSEDILVERCTIWSACNCLKIGTETHDHSPESASPTAISTAGRKLGWSVRSRAWRSNRSTAPTCRTSWSKTSPWTMSGRRSSSASATAAGTRSGRGKSSPGCLATSATSPSAT